MLLMLRDSPSPKRPSSKLEHNARAAFDSAGFFNNFHAFTRRGKPFQRVRQSVPRVHLRSGNFDSRTANKGFRFHFVSIAEHSNATRASNTKCRRRTLADCTISRCTGPGTLGIQYRESKYCLRTPESKVNRTIPEISRGEYGPFI